LKPPRRPITGFGRIEAYKAIGLSASTDRIAVYDVNGSGDEGRSQESSKESFHCTLPMSARPPSLGREVTPPGTYAPAAARATARQLDIPQP